MKHHCISPIVTCAAAVLAALSVRSSAPAAASQGRTTPPAAANSRFRGGPFPRQLTVFDREGKLVGVVGDPDVYQQPMFSPDGTRLAVVKLDPQTRAQDLWLFDVKQGTGTHFTDTQGLEAAPGWSLDGKRVAYSSYRDDRGGLYTKPADGSGAEELVYSAEVGTTLGLTDWSPDGRFMTFTSGGVLFYLPLDGKRVPIELLRDEFSNIAARFSPDGRFFAYRSDESGRNEIYVRAFEPSSATAPAGTKWQISNQGGLGLIQWRQDGKELYYLAADGGLMAAAVTTTPTFKAEAPRLLFRAPATIPLTGTPGGLASISADGQRFVFAVPTPPVRTPVIVAREILEKYVGTYAGPGNNDVVVTLEDDELMIQPNAGQRAFLLHAASETSFYFQSAEPEIDFVKDDNGNVTHFVLYQGGRASRALRK